MNRPDIDYDALNPGIRETVRWLRSLGFDTVDSGDGETHEYECDCDEPYVVMRWDNPQTLSAGADLLLRALLERGINVCTIFMGEVCIQATYDPVDQSAMIYLSGVNDAMLEASHAS
jgi:hypothetical protein